MAFSVQMPALGESVTEGTVTRWLKQEGETVAVDEPLLEVSTDKVDTEIPSPAAGVLQRIVVPEDETVEVGAELAVIGDGADDGADDGGPGGGSTASDGSDDAGRSAEAAPAAETPAAETPAAEPAATRHAAPAGDADAGSDGSGSGSGASGSGSGGSASGGSGSGGSASGGSGSGGSGEGTAVTMPALGESVTEGTVTRWLKQVGDEVAVDEPLLEVSTDKVDTEIPSPVAGTLLEITAGDDETVEVGGRLALIGSRDAGAAAAPKDEPAPAAPQESPWREPGSAESAEEPAKEQQRVEEEQLPENQPAAPAGPDDSAPDADSNGAGGAPYVTPLVRKLAAEHGVDLTSVRGTGVGGRIRKQDVLAAVEQPETPPAAEPAPGSAAEPASEPAAAPAAAPPAARAPVTAPSGEPSANDAASLRGTSQKLSRLRKVIAQRMVESLQVSAQLTAVVEVDVTRVAQLRQRAKANFEAREGVKLSFLPFFVKATVDTLKLYPNVNASIDTEKNEVTYHDAEHIGIAVDTERGLLVPVVHNAGDLSLAGIARQIADLAERTRTNKMKPDELAGGTFTITNIGSRGALSDTPIINQPQVAILGTGAVVKRPVVVTDDLGQDTIAIRSIAALVLTYDHRLVDGADAARFLSSVKHRIEQAAFEADLGL
ncbi:MAG: 2-oxoglutarate dehydrogenase, E2 component, dihydrolipoamide succinyltransferase [Pseudonocardia sp.]